MITVPKLLELKNVTIKVWSVKERRWVSLFTDWSFDMEAGEVVLVLGGSGTGKTTLLHFIAGFLRSATQQRITPRTISKLLPVRGKHPQVTGQILISGIDVTQLAPQERPVGLVMQRYTLYEHMTVRENLEFPLRMRNVPREAWAEKVAVVIKRVGLSENVLSERALPQQLAGGQMQRIAIGKMLLRQPKLALFDEAFSNLDLLLRTQLRQTVVDQFIRERPDEHGVVFVSHNVESARTADKIIFLPNREGTSDGPLVFGGKGTPAWEEFCACDKLAEIQNLVLRVYEIASDWSNVNRNAFGERRYSPNEVLNDKKLIPTLKKALKLVCDEVSISEDDSSTVEKVMFERSATMAMSRFEDDVRRRVLDRVDNTNMRNALDRRAERIYQQIESRVVGNTVADIGCGDGMVGWKLNRKGLQVEMTDVVNYLDKRVELPLHVYKEGESLPLVKPVDTSLLLTVLHHSLNPMKLLEETLRLTKRRCIIIESVYGVTGNAAETGSLLLELEEEEQRKYATFIDWLYNRVFHDGVPVPYNYNTPKRWKRLFEDAGCCVKEVVDLGIDQPIVPEHHVLFVLDKT